MDSIKMDGLAIGVDVGATKIAAALVSRSGEVLSAGQAATEPELGIRSVLDRLGEQVNGLMAEAGGRMLGVGIGTPGQVDSLRGVVRNAVNMGWDEVPLAAEVRSRLAQDASVWIQKDANASALGEYVFGAARGCADFVYIGIGSGLGGGVMANHRLVTGANWNAAELGHLSLDPGSPLVCVCGLHGCAETIVSGPGLANLARRMVQAGERATCLPEVDSIDAAAVLAAARQGDRLALEALEILGHDLGKVLAACVAVLNPGRVVIGGGLGLAAYEFILPAAQAELGRRTLPGSCGPLEFVPSRLASSAVGAASLVWYFSELVPA